MSEVPTTTKVSLELRAEGRKESDEPEQMCCDGKRTAAEHRSESADGTCCSDS